MVFSHCQRRLAFAPRAAPTARNWVMVFSHCQRRLAFAPRSANGAQLGRSF